MQNNGLNAGMNKLSFWQRLKGGISRVLEFAAGSGGFIGLLATIIQELSGLRESELNELTPSSEYFLMKYLQTKFYPFYNTLAHLIDGSYVIPADETFKTIADNSEFIDRVNVARRRYAVLLAFSQHEINNPNLTDSRWSTEVLNTRHEVFLRFYGKLNTAITQYMANNNITGVQYKPVTFNASAVTKIGALTFDWRGFKAAGSYDELLGGTVNLDSDFNNEDMFPDHDLTLEDMQDADVIGGLDDILVNGEISPPRPTDTTTDTTTANNNPTTTNKWLKVAAVLGLSYVIGKAVSRKSK